MSKKYHFSKIIHQSAGFTLLELIITMAILMGVVATVFLLQNFMYTQQNVAFESFLSVENANRSMEQMVKEIRNARSGDDGAYPLQVCADHNLTLFTNVDSDEATEKVQYFLEGTQLKKAVINPTGVPPTYTGSASVTVIADGIVNYDQPIFTYHSSNYNGSGSGLTPNLRQLQTRLIRIQINANQGKDSVDTEYTISAQAQIRNLKDNL